MAEQDDGRPFLRLRDFVVILVVVVILGALASFGLKRMTEAANRTATNNNLRQCGIAVHTAVGDYKRLPPSGTNVPTGFGQSGMYGNRAGNLYYHLLVYSDNGRHYNEMPGVVTLFYPPYHAVSDPSDHDQETGTSFPFNGWVFNQGGNIVGKNLKDAIPDGTSFTIMFSTGAIKSNTLRDISKMDPVTCNITRIALPQFDDWFPGDANTTLFQAFESVEIAVCMGDASIRRVTPFVNALSWKAAMIPDDKSRPGEDF